MNRMILIVCISMLPLSSTAYERGDQLLWACSGDETEGLKPALDKMHCYGYIQGFLDSAQIIFSLAPESRFFCPPTGGMSLDQQIRIVTKSLETHPEQLHESARSSVMLAFADAFPCN